MRKIFFFTLLLVLSVHAYCQQFKAEWLADLKLKKSVSDYEFTGTDSAGYYLIERNINNVSLVNSDHEYRDYYTITKFDKNFKEEWDRNYFKDLVEVDIFSIRLVNNEPVIFATDWLEKEKQFRVYAIKVDKSNGNLSEKFIELGSYEAGKRKEDFIEAKISTIHSGKNYLIASDLSGKKQVGFGVTMLDSNLTPLKSIIIQTDFTPGLYDVQDINYLQDRVLLLGKIFEEHGRGEKKKRVFEHFILSIYNEKGIKLTDIVLYNAGQVTIAGKLLELPGNEAGLVSFFSKEKNKAVPDGCSTAKIDLIKNEISWNPVVEIPAASFENQFIDQSGDSEKRKRKNKAEENERDHSDSSQELSIVNISTSPADGSTIIAAEISRYDLYTHTTYSYPNSYTSYLYNTRKEHMIVMSAGGNGSVNWVNVIPKQQQAKIREPLEQKLLNAYNYFPYGKMLPLFSSFSAQWNNGKYVILYNDHKNNTTTGDHSNVSTLADFREAAFYALSIDPLTDRQEKSLIGPSLIDDLTIMPDHIYSSGNTLILTAWKTNSMAKNGLKIARLTLQ